MNPLPPFTLNSSLQSVRCFTPIYVQNASLEFAHGYRIRELSSISGNSIVPYITPKDEDVDINYPHDWIADRRYT